MGAKKRQNKITEYRQMLLAWKRAGAITYAGYILGFPERHPRFDHARHRLIKRELPIDMLEFFYLTPLPGSEDHLKLFRAGAPLDPDLNRYDLNHVCTTASAHVARGVGAGLSHGLAALLHHGPHRDGAAAHGRLRRQCRQPLLPASWFTGSLAIENIHPLESGFLRRKSRRDRRPGFKREPVWLFYPRYWWETASKLARWASLFARIRMRYLPIKKNPDKRAYRDPAITPVTDAEEGRALFQTEAAQAWLDQEHRLDKYRHGDPAKKLRSAAS